jgi:acid-sensing ion channel, other
MLKNEYFLEYAENSTIHGLKYIGDRKRHIIERIFWAIFLIFSIIGCGFIIKELYSKWNRSPVIVSFSEKMTPIKEIPFPALTICPLSKFDHQMINFTDSYVKFMYELEYGEKILTPEELKIFEAAILTCDLNLIEKGLYWSWNMSIANLKSEEIVDCIEKITPDLIVYNLKYGVHVDYMFNRIITEEGPCITFNMISLSEIYTNESVT